MDIKAVAGKVPEFLKKYRYALLVLVIGLVLMLLPGKSEQKSTSGETAAPAVTGSSSVSQELEQILSQISGAGKVRVMLTVARGEETVYQTNEDTSTSENSASTRIDTVTITDSERNESGLIRQVNPQSYLGAIVLCQGAQSASVRLAIMDAVSKVTGLGTDHICVLKMN